jgi:PAS domain S-box-containing protein
MVDERANGPQHLLPTSLSLVAEMETPHVPAVPTMDNANLAWQKGYRQLQLIHQLTLAVVQANELTVIYEEALRGLQEVVGADRAAVLLFDDGGVMQFVAWRGLSNDYRAAAAGHSPWTPDAADPQPLLVSDVAREASLAALAERITSEGIWALAFIPLLYHGRLIGKFMLYYNRPHSFSDEEVQLAQTIAGQVALAIERQRTTQALQEAKDQLEQRVAARTAELRQRNDALQTEITRREKVEAILRQNEEQYRTLARNIPKAAVFLFDRELRLKLVEGDEKIHPSFYKGAEGRTVWELMPPEEYETRGRYYQEALQGISHVYERTINGRTLQVYVLPIQNQQGEIAAVMTMAQDISDHKEAQATLARNAEQLGALNEVGQVIASSLDLNVVFSRVLDSLRRLLDAEGVFILLQEGNDLVFVATNETQQGRMLGRRLPLDEFSVSAEVFRTGRPLLIKGEALQSHVTTNRTAQESGYFPQALLAVPLKLQGVPIGVMAASHQQPEAFSEADSPLLEAVAVWTAIAIGNARQHQALQRRLRESEALTLITQALSETLDMDLVLRLIAVAAQQIIPNVDWSVIHLLDDKKQLLYPAAVAGLELPAGEYILHPGEGIGGRVIEEGKVINVTDIQQDPRRAPVHERLGLRALLVCPVQSRTRRLGTITIHRASAERFSAEDERLLGTLGNQVAVAIENARLFRQVESSRERLRQLTQKVVSAQEEERRRISYDLHDEAGQALTAVKINLSMLAAEVPDAQEPLRHDLIEVRDLVGQTLERIRLLAHDLRPPIVDSFSLNLALENMCKEFGRRTNYEITYQGEELEHPLSDEATISFYRFVQEALTNVIKHAEASQVEVVLRREPDKIVVSVIDNGRGFDIEESGSYQGRSGGIGLTGMQERFGLLDGQLKINSVLGKGTRVTAEAPYQIGKVYD